MKVGEKMWYYVIYIQNVISIEYSVLKGRLHLSRVPNRVWQ